MRPKVQNMENWCEVITYRKVHDLLTRLARSEKRANETLGRIKAKMAVLSHPTFNNNNRDDGNCGCRNSDSDPSDEDIEDIDLAQKQQDEIDIVTLTRRSTKGIYRQSVASKSKNQEVYNPNRQSVTSNPKNQEVYNPNRQSVASKSKNQEVYNPNRQSVTSNPKNQEVYNPNRQSVGSNPKNQEVYNPNEQGVASNRDIQDPFSNHGQSASSQPENWSQDPFLVKPVQNIDPALCIGKTWDLVAYHMNRISFHCECFNNNLPSDMMTNADRLHCERFHRSSCTRHSKCSMKSSVSKRS